MRDSHKGEIGGQKQEMSYLKKIGDELELLLEKRETLRSTLLERGLRKSSLSFHETTSHELNFRTAKQLKQPMYEVSLPFNS